MVENDGVLILSGKEPAGEEKTADKNSVTAGNNADILNVDGGQVKLSNLTLKDSKSAAIVANSAIFQAINTTFANMNNGAVKNAGNATFSGKNDFVNNIVADGNGGALNLKKESETKFSDSSLFENNTAATGNGGAMYGDGSVYLGDQNKLISAVFTNNTAKDGGAVFVDENGKFVGYGEFIFGQNSAANGNKATNSGGAIYNKGQMSFVGFNGKETKSIIFVANQATNGGAIYNTGALNLNGQLSFIGNSALYDNSEDDTKGFGGAIYNTGTLDIYGTNIEFSNNTAQKAGGAIYNNGGVVNISGSGISFNNNKVLETDKLENKVKSKRKNINDKETHIHGIREIFNNEDLDSKVILSLKTSVCNGNKEYKQPKYRNMLQTKDKYNDDKNGAKGWMKYLNKGTCSNNGLYISDSLLEKIRNDYNQLYKDYVECIKELKSKGFKIKYNQIP